MDTKSKILFWVTGLLILLSVAATFYRTVILQDFEVTGVWMEVYEDNTSYVWFFYDNEEYELELETADQGEVLSAIALEVGMSSDQMDQDFLNSYEYAYSQADLATE